MEHKAENIWSCLSNQLVLILGLLGAYLAYASFQVTHGHLVRSMAWHCTEQPGNPDTGDTRWVCMDLWATSNQIFCVFMCASRGRVWLHLHSSVRGATGIPKIARASLAQTQISVKLQQHGHQPPKFQVDVDSVHWTHAAHVIGNQAR